jgi:hypothetical protein
MTHWSKQTPWLKQDVSEHVFLILAADESW